jgi:nicotinamidase-related amidase
MDIDWNNAVLLPIDMQRAFDGSPWPKRWNGRVDENGLALLRKWREAGRPIIHVQHDSVVEGSSLGPASEGNRFRPGFEPEAGEPIVSKSVNSAFIGTDLDLRLRRLGARHVVTFGISTDMCVSTTVRTGSNMGWDMICRTPATALNFPTARAGRSRPSQSRPRTSRRWDSNSARSYRPRIFSDPANDRFRPKADIRRQAS